eukprot:365294-Chlamydomonas_euryale.AAC.8
MLAHADARARARTRISARATACAARRIPRGASHRAATRVACVPRSRRLGAGRLPHATTG